MKKLMIAAAIVCAAVLSQASTVQWKVTNIKVEGGSKVDAGTYYVMCFAADSAGNILGKDISISDAKSYASKGDITSLAAKANFAGVNSAYGQHVSAYTSNVFSTDDTIKLYAIVFNDDVPGDATKFQVLDDPVSYKFADSAEDKTLTISMADAKWYNIQSVPEPTSAMMLLLGVAGLALRRRRA